jgi:hypothetical protein
MLVPSRASFYWGTGVLEPHCGLPQWRFPSIREHGSIAVSRANSQGADPLRHVAAWMHRENLAAVRRGDPLRFACGLPDFGQAESVSMQREATNQKDWDLYT